MQTGPPGWRRAAFQVFPNCLDRTTSASGSEARRMAVRRLSAGESGQQARPSAASPRVLESRNNQSRWHRTKRQDLTARSDCRKKEVGL